MSVVAAAPGFTLLHATATHALRDSSSKHRQILVNAIKATQGVKNASTPLQLD